MSARANTLRKPMRCIVTWPARAGHVDARTWRPRRSWQKCDDPSLDHLVGTQQLPLRDRDAERVRRLQVDDVSYRVGCSTGRSAGLAPLRMAGVHADLAIHVGKVGAVAHQACGPELAQLVDRRRLLCCAASVTRQ